MRKTFELFDNVLDESVLGDLGRLSAGGEAKVIASLARSTSWWSSDTTTTAHVPIFTAGELTNEALTGAVWAGLFCSLTTPLRSLSLKSKLNDGRSDVSSKSVVLPLWRNCLVLFDAALLSANVEPTAVQDNAGLWLICASRATGGP